MWGIEKKKKDYQTKTYSKYHLPRSKKDGRDYKICGSDKKISHQPKKIAVMCEISATTKPEVVAQLVNEMRALIQEMKTVIEAVTGKLSPKTQTGVATNQGKQAKPDRKNSGALTSGVTSVAGPLQTPPKRKTKGKPPRDGQRHGTKQEKIDSAHEQELPQALNPLNRGFHLPNWENTDEHQNEKPGSTFKMPTRTVTYTNQ